MRFNPDAYASHPILRPNSDDYPSGEFDTEMKADRTGDVLEISLSFRIAEPAVERKVASGAAVCCAYLYCASTCFSELMRAEKGADSLRATVPLSVLNGRVEIHPSIIALEDTALRAGGANAEYGDAPIVIPRFNQMAAGTPWYLAVGLIGSVESAFRLEKDAESNLAYGEFDFDVDTGDRQIAIRMNAETYERFNDVRGERGVSMSTVYLAALTSALASVNPDSDGGEDESPDGWAASLRARLKEKNIDLQAVSIGLAAQRLLDTPLSYILREDAR